MGFARARAKTAWGKEFGFFATKPAKAGLCVSSDVVVFVVIGDEAIGVAGRFVIARGNDVAIGEPAIEIDVGAAGRAEGAEFFHHGLAADRAGFGGSSLAHQTTEDWLSQLKCTG